MIRDPLPPKVAVVGAGPAGLMAAEVLTAGGAAVTIFDRMPSPGRKFLLAGRGGLNLTHSEDAAVFLSRYGDAAPWLAPLIARFGPSDLRTWCEGLGIETFVGTSGRVFPVSFKTSPLLRAWLRRLDASGVRFHFKERWVGWDAEGRPCFETAAGATPFEADATVLALGGASWPHLGSDGGWVEVLAAAGLRTARLRPANCGFVADWSTTFRDRFEGQPLKNLALAFEGRRERGDAMVTRIGIEGAPVYALAGRLREAIAAHGDATILVDLRPDMDVEAVAGRWARRRAKESMSNALRKTLSLAPAGIGFLRDCPLEPDTRLSDLADLDLARLIKAVPIRLTAPMPLDRAISTAGGVRVADLGDELMLRPGVFVAGEMLDWEAPTGGYLLQACFATGVAAGEGVLAWLRSRGRLPGP